MIDSSLLTCGRSLHPYACFGAEILNFAPSPGSPFSRRELFVIERISDTRNDPGAVFLKRFTIEEGSITLHEENFLKSATKTSPEDYIRKPFDDDGLRKVGRTCDIGLPVIYFCPDQYYQQGMFLILQPRYYYPGV
jgi:hypothetical protein